LHPLLNCPFGENKYCIYILKECDQEYSNSSALQNKFLWVNQVEYATNRKNVISYSAADDNAISNSIKFIKVFAKENYLNVSIVDVKYLATALELDITLITDDSDMITVAEEFQIKVMKSLELLKLMLDCGYITLDKVKEITDYWCHSKDLPKHFKRDCKNIFDFDY